MSIQEGVTMLRSHATSWKRRPTYPVLRFAAGETHEILIVGEPWTFDLPKKPNEKFPPVRHLANVILRPSLNDPGQPACIVWEINDKTFRTIQVDPTAYWLRVTRQGSGIYDTRYVVEPVRPATPEEIRAAKSHIMIDLELVAAERQSDARI
jgi:hypothetical protein